MLKIDKKLITSGAIIVGTFAFASSALAVNDLGITKTINQANRIEAQASAAGEKQASRLTNAKTRSDTLITNRLNELSKLLSRIQNDNRLIADDKANLSTDVQNATEGLTNLKSKIDADTDIATLRTDIQQIFSVYRVYEVLTPKTQLLITIDSLQALVNNLQTLTPKLDDLLSTLSSQGKDTSSLTPVVTDIKAQLQTINTHLSQEKTTVMAVTINTQNPQATFTSVRKDLAGVRQNFAKIRADVAKLRGSLKIVIKGSGAGATPSATISSQSGKQR